MSRSAESARHEDVEKIEFSCTCGKTYRVPASKAGKRVRCKRCRVKITVPGDAGAVSLRTRKAILAEIGVDAEAAEHAYEAMKRYVCGTCSAPIAEADLPAAYGEEGLACAECRAAAVEERAIGEPGADGDKKKKKKLETWATQGTVEDARRKSYAYGVLFFFGIAGLLNVLGVGIAINLVVAALVAFGGSKLVFKAYEPVPQPIKAKV